MNRPIHIGGLCHFTRLFISGVVALQLLSAFANARNSPDESNTQQESGAGHLPAVRLDGHYFSREGRRFIPVGANWVPAKAAMEWPYEWDPKAIEADFGRMRELGFNTIRLDLVWAWFEPRPDDFNPEAFRQLDFLISLAHRYHIYLHPCFLIGGEVGEAYWDVSYRNGRNPQADPYMLRLETDFASEFARRYGKETAILAWDLTDEPPFWIAEQTTDSMAINWTRLLTAAVRRHDSLHPLVVGTSMEDVGHGPFRPDNLRDDVDFSASTRIRSMRQSFFPIPCSPCEVRMAPHFKRSFRVVPGARLWCRRSELRRRSMSPSRLPSIFGRISTQRWGLEQMGS